MYGRLLQLKVYKRLIINDAYVKYKISNSTSRLSANIQQKAPNRFFLYQVSNYVISIY